MSRPLIALLSGALFGAGLHASGMTDTARVRGFLDIVGAWDPTLAFVMIGAILPMVLAWRVSRGRVPLTGGSFPQPAKSTISKSLIVGSVFFGVGWGLVGLCPGPAVASLSYGGWEGAVFFASMVTGMWFLPKLRAGLDRRKQHA